MTPRWTLVSVVAAAASACSGVSAPTPSESPLRLVALNPGAAETLSAGATVSVGLTLASDSAGRVTLSIRDQTGARLLVSEPAVDLVPQQETILEASFVVPRAASSIDVLADFRPAAAGVSPTVLHVGYVVR